MATSLPHRSTRSSSSVLNAIAHRYELTPPPQESHSTYLPISVSILATATDKLITSTENVERELEGHIVATNEGFIKLEKKLDFHIIQTGKGFQKVDERFQMVDERFDRMEERFNRIESRQHNALLSWPHKPVRPIGAYVIDTQERKVWDMPTSKLKKK
jgi:hypothetical protein